MTEMPLPRGRAAERDLSPSFTTMVWRTAVIVLLVLILATLLRLHDDLKPRSFELTAGILTKLIDIEQDLRLARLGQGAGAGPAPAELKPGRGEPVYQTESECEAASGVGDCVSTPLPFGGTGFLVRPAQNATDGSTK